VSDLVAWSYSRLNGYETCPRKYWHQTVNKTPEFQEAPSDAQSYGEDVHKAFKLYFKAGAPLPLHLRQYEKQLAAIAAAPGYKIVEQQIALDKNFKQVEWYAKDTYLRVISDLTQHNGKAAIIWDHKTGKPHSDFSQLELTAAVTFLLGPEIDRITMAYLWLKTKAATSQIITRDQAPDVWAKLQPRVQKFQQAYIDNNWPPKPNYLCKGYCPVTTCQYWEKGKRR